MYNNQNAGKKLNAQLLFICNLVVKTYFAIPKCKENSFYILHILHVAIGCFAGLNLLLFILFVLADFLWQFCNVPGKEKTGIFRRLLWYSFQRIRISAAEL